MARRSPHDFFSVMNLVEAQVLGVKIDENHLKMTNKDLSVLSWDAFENSKKDREFDYKSVNESINDLKIFCKSLSEKNKHATSILDFIEGKYSRSAKDFEGSFIRNFPNYKSEESEIEIRKLKKLKAKEIKDRKDKIGYAGFVGCIWLGVFLFIVFIIAVLASDGEPNGQQIYCARQGLVC